MAGASSPNHRNSVLSTFYVRLHARRAADRLRSTREKCACPTELSCFKCQDLIRQWASKSGAIQTCPWALPATRRIGFAAKGTRRATGFPALAACRRENNARPGLPNPGPGEANDDQNNSHCAGKPPDCQIRWEHRFRSSPLRQAAGNHHFLPMLMRSSNCKRCVLASCTLTVITVIPASPHQRVPLPPDTPAPARPAGGGLRTHRPAARRGSTHRAGSRATTRRARPAWGLWAPRQPRSHGHCDKRRFFRAGSVRKPRMRRTAPRIVFRPAAARCSGSRCSRSGSRPVSRIRIARQIGDAHRRAHIEHKDLAAGAHAAAWSASCTASGIVMK